MRMPANRGQTGGHGERVQLDPEHRDAERRGGALVGSHRDEPASGPRTAEVGDEQREQHEADQAHRGPGVWMVERVDLDPEQLHPPDPGPAVEPAAQVVGVREHDFRHEEAEAERDDREVHPAGPERGNREGQADWDREENAEHDGELDGDVGAYEPAGDQRADAGERPLRERDLTGIPVRTTIDRIMTALAREMYVAWAQASSITPNSRASVIADARRSPRMLISPVPSFGNRARHVRPQRQTPSADDDHEEDHEERGHAVEPADEVLVEEVLDVVAVERCHRLPDTDDQPADERRAGTSGNLRAEPPRARPRSPRR